MNLTASPSLLRIHALEAGYELLRMLRTPAFALPTLAFPVVFYVLFALLLPGKWGDYSKAAYLFATYAAFGVMGPALSGFGIGLALEREQGWLELKRASPMPMGAYFFAKLAMSVTFGLTVVILLAIPAVLFGNVRLPFLTWFALFFAMALGSLPFCALGLLIGAWIRGQAAIAVVNLVYLPMAVLSGLWMPIFVFPAFLQKLAVLWPAYHLGRISLALVGQLPQASIALHAAVLAMMTALLLAAAAWRMRRL